MQSCKLVFIYWQGVYYHCRDISVKNVKKQEIQVHAGCFSHLESAFYTLNLPLITLQQCSCNPHVCCLPAAQHPPSQLFSLGGQGGRRVASRAQGSFGGHVLEGYSVCESNDSNLKGL